MTQQPFLERGRAGLEAYASDVLGGGFGTDVPVFEDREFAIEADPGFQFRLQQGTEAINRAAAARGGALGGGVLKELSRYGQGLASDEADRAYRRFAGERAFDYGALGDLYNRQVQQQAIRQGTLRDLAGIGQAAAGTEAGLATQLGGNLADLAMQRGNVMAQRTAAQSGALGGFLGGLGQMGQQAGMLGAMGAFKPVRSLTPNLTMPQAPPQAPSLYNQGMFRP